MKNNETDAILGVLAKQSFGFYPLDPAKRLASTEKKLATNATRSLLLRLLRRYGRTPFEHLRWIHEGSMGLPCFNGL